MNRFNLIVFILLLGLLQQSPALAAQSSKSSGAITSTTCSKSEINAGSTLVSNQLAALRVKKFKQAYGFASKVFHSSKTLSEFQMIISTDYSMLIGFKNYRILSCDRKDYLYLFILNLVGKDQKLWKINYVVSNRNGIWGVEAAAASLSSDQGRINA